MIIKTILSGQEVDGLVNKKVILPYSGSSTTTLQYSKINRIGQFVNIDDLKMFRKDLENAAESMLDYLEKNEEIILKTVADETGSPIHYHRQDLRNSITFLKSISVLGKFQTSDHLYESKGNILLILPANEPITTGTILVFSALFMGNNVFVKPSSRTPSFCYLLVRELSKLPFLTSRVHFLSIEKDEVERLIRKKTFNFVISFAGRSTNTKLSVVCAESEVEFCQESEGNDWAYIDKNYEVTQEFVEIIVNSFIRHNGQMCNSLRGIMVHSSVYKKLIGDLQEKISSVLVGSPNSPATRVSALISGTVQRAVQLVREVQSTVDGIWNFTNHDNIITPSIVLNPGNSSPILTESIFAPILWLKSVDNHSEALSLYHSKNMHGLGFSVFSYDNEVLDKFVSQIKVGRLNINVDPLQAELFDPIGGVKLSGHGGPNHWVQKFSDRKFINR